MRDMADQGNGSVSRDPEGQPIPRRSGRASKPKISVDFTNHLSNSIKRREANRMRGAKSTRRGRGGAGTSGTSGKRGPMPKNSKYRNENDAYSETDESDLENGEYEGPENDLENRVSMLEDALAGSFKLRDEDMADFTFVSKLIFSSLPKRIIQKLRAFSAEDNKNEILEDYLDGMINPDNDDGKNWVPCTASSSGGAGSEGRVPAVGRGAGAGVGETHMHPHQTPAAPPVTDLGNNNSNPDSNSSTLNGNQTNPQDRGPNNSRHNNITNSSNQGPNNQRKKNLIVKGMDENLNDGDQGGFNRLLRSINCEHLMGNVQQGKRIGRLSSGRPKILCVTFYQEESIDEIIGNKTKLFRTNDYSQYGDFSGVFLDRDLTFDEREREYRIRRDNRYNESRSESRGGGQMGDINNPNTNPGSNVMATGGNHSNGPDRVRSAVQGEGGDRTTNNTNSGTNENAGGDSTVIPASRDGTDSSSVANDLPVDNIVNLGTTTPVPGPAERVGGTNTQSIPVTDDTINVSDENTSGDNNQTVRNGGDGEVLNGATTGTIGNVGSDTSLMGTPRRLFNMAMSNIWPNNVAQNQGNDQRGEGEMGQ